MNSKQAIRQASLAKWTALFKEQKASGLLVRDWCSQNNVSINAYYYWKRIAKDEYIKSLVPNIPQIPASSDEPSDQLVNPDASQSHELYNLSNFQNATDPISVSIGDIRIEIGASAPDSMITRIIGAIRHA